MKIYPPGSTIGILGGGQLGRMTALAAARLGYHTHIFCPEDDAPALEVSGGWTRAAFEDEEALTRFADAVDLVTLEWENVPLATLRCLAPFVPVRPGLAVLKVAQDRVLEKSFAHENGIATTPFVALESAEELAEAMKSFPLPGILKSTRMGYDGKGQVAVARGDDPVRLWAEMGGQTGILEAFVPFACEISVIVARREDGAMASYPPVQNKHENHVLAQTIAPAVLDPQIAAEATALAQNLAQALGVIGLLAVEMFVLPRPNAEGKRVLMNEIAPRPHNSGHWTLDACETSQFEQLIRAIAGLPLGQTTPLVPSVMFNLLGEAANDWEKWLAEPGACLHLYGKADLRPGRKMGHVTLLKRGG